MKDLSLYKYLPEYKRYAINTEGEVWDTQRKRFLRSDNKGLVRLLTKSGVEHLQVRYAVYSLFVESISDTEKVINIDGNKRNNKLNNLVKVNIKTAFQDYVVEYPPYIVRRNLLIRHRSMMYRCYNDSTYNTKNYDTYGGKGVIVCKEWENYIEYAKWFVNNYIPTWVIDKDFLNLEYNSPPKYSPETCVFVPEKLNSFFASLTKVGKKNGVVPIKYYNKFGYTVTMHGRSVYLSGETAEDVTEQYNLIKELHLEKLTLEMLAEHENLLLEYKDIPPISQKLLEGLDNFSMTRFLKSCV